MEKTEKAAKCHVCPYARRCPSHCQVSGHCPKEMQKGEVKILAPNPIKKLLLSCKKN